MEEGNSNERRSALNVAMFPTHLLPQTHNQEATTSNRVTGRNGTFSLQRGCVDGVGQAGRWGGGLHSPAPRRRPRETEASTPVTQTLTPPASS